MKKILLTLCFVLLSVPCFASSSNTKSLMVKYAKMYNVEPAFLIAVGHIESRKGNSEFRYGLVSKYYMPMGIHKDFLKKWDVSDLETNIAVGARALSGVGSDENSQKKRLRRYNATFNNGYWYAVQSAKNKYRRELCQKD